jgi:serine/threonine-protein kinase
MDHRPEFRPRVGGGLPENRVDDEVPTMKPTPLKSFFPLLICSVGLFLPSGQATSEDGPPDAGNLNSEAVKILETYCYGCHGIEYKVEGLDILNREVLLSTDVLPPYISPGKLHESYLWEMVSTGAMPPKKAEKRPSEGEVETIRLWILAGAEFPAEAEPPQDEAEVPAAPVPIEQPETQPLDPTGAQRVAPLAPIFPASLTTDPGAAVAAILEKYCHRCHGVEFKKEGLDILDHSILLDPSVEAPYVVPGNAEASNLWRVLAEDAMPPRKIEERPSEEEKALVLAWIMAGAPPFPISELEQRPRLDDRWVLETIAADLRHREENDRVFRRYFSLAPLFSNPGVSRETLDLHRAALSKLLNSLTWQSDIILPEPVDPEGVVLAIDLRDLLWDSENNWDRIMAAYPYGLVFNSAPDQGMRLLAQEVYRLTDCQLPYVRLDWFVYAASKPPLYHDLLGLPQNAHELERRLGVDIARNFERGALARAGFAQSGVSTQNRIVERHRSQFGAYWVSYDFATNDGPSNIFQNPLGPLTFATPQGNVTSPFEHLAFEQAGGEIIFNLPNGLQAYLLVDGEGNRIDEGPIQIVNDANQTVGNPTVTNGVSCMVCHQNGMRTDFTDEIRMGSGAFGEAMVKVQELYPPQEEMTRLLAGDQERFLSACLQAMEPFLKNPNPGDPAYLTTLKEPVGEVFQSYLADLTPETAAYELGLESPEMLLMAIKINPELKMLGLGAFSQGGFLQRENWESLIGLTSVFQKTAVNLELGTPYRSF